MAGKYRRKRNNWRWLTVPLGLFLMAWLIVTMFHLLPEAAPSQGPEKNPYTPEDFVWKDGYLTCRKGGQVGIDVSSHQGKIDWQQVADAGVEFVMIRVGYRGYDTGLLHQDERAQENYEGAQTAGLSVGAYFFSQAMTPSEAAQEARLALMMVDGWELTLPLVFDWEYVSEDARTALATRQVVTACAKAFCSAVEQAGHKSMIYCNPHVAETYLDLDTLADRDIWLALYADTLSYPYRVAMWQYTQTGEVPGIREKVDINILLP